MSMKISLLINMKMPTIVGIFIFISRENFMLSWVEHEKCFITSGPDASKFNDGRVHCRNSGMKGLNCMFISQLIISPLSGGHLSQHMAKPNKMDVRPAKTQISLGVRSVWAESSLSVQSVVKDPTCLHADSEDWPGWAEAQADLSLRWAHVLL